MTCLSGILAGLSLLAGAPGGTVPAFGPAAELGAGPELGSDSGDGPLARSDATDQAPFARLPRRAFQPGAGARYALIPPRNLSGFDDASRELLAPVQRALEARGASFVPDQEIETLLARRRVRYTDSLPLDELGELARATGATHALVATIFDCSPGSEPRVSFTLRAVDCANGRRALSSAVALRGPDFEGLLGLGRIERLDELAREAARLVLEEFDARGAPRTDRAGTPSSSRPRPPDGGTGFARDEFVPRELERLALLPFDNRSGRLDAPVQFAEYLGDAWFREAGVELVEPAQLRGALLRERVRSLQFLDAARLAAIGEELGVRYFVLGAIEHWGEDVLIAERRTPEVEARVEILDSRTGRIVAAAALARRGSDYETLLGLGAVHDPAELARRASRELVLALGG